MVAKPPFSAQRPGYSSGTAPHTRRLTTAGRRAAQKRSAATYFKAVKARQGQAVTPATRQRATAEPGMETLLLQEDRYRPRKLKTNGFQEDTPAGTLSAFGHLVMHAAHRDTVCIDSTLRGFVMRTTLKTITGPAAFSPDAGK